MSQSAAFRAKYGTTKMIDAAQHSDDEDARAEVASRHADRAEKMLNDPSPYVRQAILHSHGKREHMDHFMKTHPHDHWQVSSITASKGTDEHRDKLVNHPHPLVRSAVARNGNTSHHDKLVHDPDEGVRAVVATHGTENHRRQLMTDPTSNVRREVARNTNDPTIIHHLTQDKDVGVRADANERPHRIKRFNQFLDTHGDHGLLKDFI